MPRISAFKGTWEENKRPYITIAPDAYVAIQGQTSIVTCGECNRKVDVNKYLTGISTEASVDSPPGSATINLSIPDTDANDFHVEGNFVIIPMMEIEIYAKGYYTVGGLPQYYRIFWGMVISISKNWSNGTTTYTLSCKDMLHWWEKTNVILNPAFVGSDGSSAGNFQMFGNQFAGMNPYTIIIALAKESMGDFSITDGSFTSFKPEAGPEGAVVGQYAKDVMAYWQLKFGNIWNSLVLYGTSGTAYTFEGVGMDVSPIRFANSIFKNEVEVLAENELTADFKVQPHEIAAFKVDIQRAADVQFFQNDTQSKLSVALTARDQIQYEFYCDTTGDIVFKPPFYNLNTIPNKPVSWINDFEIIDDSINDTEQEVTTHMTSSGNAFGGVTDWGLTDEITVPRTGVIDWHLLKRYGWRRQDFQCEWAGNPRKLFWFLLDMMDRVNAKRHNGTVTIPMRPEIRMGFPVWIPYYDSFYYVNGVSHTYSPGGQATTTLQLVAKRSKFIAPRNLGRIKRIPAKPANKPSPNAQSGNKADKNQKAATKTGNDSPPKRKYHTYEISFDGAVGQTAGLGTENQPNEDQPIIIRDPTTGKLLGYPNVVMVYRTTYAGLPLVQQAKQQGKVASHTKSTNSTTVSQYRYDQVVRSLYTQLHNDQRTAIINRIRMHRYEAGMSNAGLYDYAVDESGDFKEMSVIPIDSIIWGAGTDDPKAKSGAVTSSTYDQSKNKKGKGGVPGGKTQEPPEKDQGQSLYEERTDQLNAKIKAINVQLNGEKSKDKKSDGGLIGKQRELAKKMSAAKTDFLQTVKKNHKGKAYNSVKPEEYSAEEKQKKAIADSLKQEYDDVTAQIKALQAESTELNRQVKDFKIAKNFNVSVRPVSDEFGFEVMGHNRYGRGVFVDRGHLKLRMVGQEANELRIQFSASGGFLTDPPTNLKFGLQADTTPAAFEKMQPEDWITGASTHAQNEVTLTSVNTYSSAINHQIDANAQTGAIFIEADATRRSKTIWELQPTLSTLDAIGFPECNCQMSRFQWYSLLPKSVLSQILGQQESYYLGSIIYVRTGFVYVDPNTGVETQNPTSSAVRDPATIFAGPEDIQKINDEWNNKLFALYEATDPVTGKKLEKRVEVPDKESASAQIEETGVTSVGWEGGATAKSTKPDFFTLLNEYLVERFNESFKYNEEREIQDSGINLGVEIFEAGQDSYIDPDSVLGASGGSLFDRASLGDPDALEALQNQVNFDWSSSEKALDEAQKVSNDEGVFVFGTYDEKPQSEPGTAKKSTGVGSTVGGNVTSSQPQPFTPAPVKINTTPTIPENNALPTKTFTPNYTSPSKSSSHSEGILENNPAPPKK